MSGPKKVRENREKGANFDILEPEEGIPELFVDGSVSTSVGSGVTKIDFFIATESLEKDGAQIEQRLLKYRLVMPSVAWIEFCANSMATMRSQKDDVLQVIDEGRAKIEHALGEPRKTNGNE